MARKNAHCREQIPLEGQRVKLEVTVVFRQPNEGTVLVDSYNTFLSRKQSLD
jgi:hypothetical protein